MAVAVAVLVMNMLLLIITMKDLAWSCLWDNPIIEKPCYLQTDIGPFLLLLSLCKKIQGTYYDIVVQTKSISRCQSFEFITSLVVIFRFVSVIM